MRKIVKRIFAEGVLWKTFRFTAYSAANDHIGKFVLFAGINQVIRISK